MPPKTGKKRKMKKPVDCPTGGQLIMCLGVKAMPINEVCKRCKLTRKAVEYYNDVFIPAMERLSPSYREYHKALEAANDVFKKHLSER